MKMRGEKNHIRCAVFTAAVCFLIGLTGRTAQAAYVDVVDALNPLGYWRLGESSGTTATDYTAGHNGTYSGGVTLGVTGALSGDSDTAATFDGSDDMIIDIGPSADLLLTADLSVSFWVKVANFTGSSSVPDPLFTLTADAANSGTAKMAELAVDKNGDIVYTHEYGNQGTGEQTYTFDTNLLVNTWYDITLIRDSSAKDIDLYIGTDLIDTYSYTTQPEGYTEGEMSIGGYASVNFEGAIDEFAIFNSQLTGQNVIDIYNAAQVPEPATVCLLALGGMVLLGRRRK